VSLKLRSGEDVSFRLRSGEVVSLGDLLILGGLAVALHRLGMVRDSVEQMRDELYRNRR
jgi:hypothetical protein